MRLNKISKSSCLSLIIGVMGIGLAIFSMERKLPAEEESQPPAQMLKILIQNENDIEILLNMGLEIWTIEEDYIVAKLTEDEKLKVKEKFSVLPAEEKDTVPRLIKVIIPPRDTLDSEIQKKIPPLDIWQSVKDKQGRVHIIAQAYDYEIMKLKELGFTVEILHKNLRKSLNK